MAIYERPAFLAENCLPIIKGNVTLSTIDLVENHEHKLKNINILFDTGAQVTSVTEDVLSDSFRELLKDPQLDVYRTNSGLYLQMDSTIALTNTNFAMNTMVLVVPKRNVPNSRSGIVLGQRGAIDCLHFEAVPKRFLQIGGRKSVMISGGTLSYTG
jgi:hypothetical protein